MAAFIFVFSRSSGSRIWIQGRTESVLRKGIFVLYATRCALLDCLILRSTGRVVPNFVVAGFGTGRFRVLGVLSDKKGKGVMVPYTSMKSLT